MSKTSFNMVTQQSLKPEFCCFGITDDCFLRCKMCQKWKPDPGTSNLKKPDLNRWKGAVGSLRSIVEKDFLINFGGGEPLLMDGLLEIVRFAADLGFRTNIPTNAFLIDEAMARKIAVSGLSSVNISLDSMREDTHDYLRGVKGVYKKAIKAIEHLDTYCQDTFEIIICCAMYDINMDEVIEVVEWVNKEQRIRSVYLMAAMQPNNTVRDEEWRKKEFSYLWPKDIKKTHSVIDTLIDMKKRGCKISNQVCQLEAFSHYFTFPDKFVKNTPCNLDRAVHISSVGDIYICYDWPIVGNIMEGDLAEAWYSGKADKVRQDIKGCKKNCHHLINCFFEGDYPFTLE